MYNKLNERTVNHYDLGQSDTFWKGPWNLNTSQRIKNFIWKCLQNAVSTNLKLSRFMQDVSPNCTFGCIENETTEHLLFHCPYSISVWASESSPLDINFDNSKKFLDICKNWSFEKTEQTYSQLALEIQRHLSFWYKDSYQTKDTSIRFKEKPRWIAPRHAQKKLNLDAAWTSVNEPAGFALILRNDAGNFGQGRAGSISATSPEEAEVLGLLHAAAWAVEEGITNFSVEGDCKNLFDYLNGKPSQITWKNQKIIDEALEVDKSNVRVEPLCSTLDGSTIIDVRVTNSPS
ncbi:uncharacterized protein LOC113271417 [Papaver somniferum]|uniref:uncharacterized protein LOC113271417 n=1 Tax=Papaver somniferum TaxID=3469 RepID=UPI000E6FDAAA|nr:uncharacterized protein LOC113271417 [Papaver somniferum]